MEVPLSPTEVRDAILELTKSELVDLFESRCPQCEGYGHYYDASLDEVVEYCSVCGSEPDYREPSEFTKTLVEILRKHGAMP